MGLCCSNLLKIICQHVSIQVFTHLRIPTVGLFVLSLLQNVH
jgi:hypothetical protein